MPDKTALIAGASRGLGLAMCRELHRRGWSVIATVRGAAPEGLAEIARVESLDITRLDDIKALRARLQGATLNLVMANAGVANQPVSTPMPQLPDEEFFRVMATNTLGPARLLELLQDLVPAGGVLSAMSSSLGSLSFNANGAWPAYASSKAALNMLLHDIAARFGRDRAVVAMAPGWVKTDMGGANASLTIDQSIPQVIDVLTGAMGKRGLHYLNYDGERVAW